MKHTIAYARKGAAFPSFAQGTFDSRQQAIKHLEKIAGAPHTPHRTVQDGRTYFGRVMSLTDFKRL